jgi:Tfp pilus assembly protein PilX
MDRHNISQNKRDAELQLKAAKGALLYVARKISSESLSVSQVSGYIWNEIDSIDAMLKGEE